MNNLSFPVMGVPVMLTKLTNLFTNLFTRPVITTQLQETINDLEFASIQKHLEMIAASHDYQKLINQKEYLESLLPPTITGSSNTTQ